MDLELIKLSNPQIEALVNKAIELGPTIDNDKYFKFESTEFKVYQTRWPTRTIISELARPENQIEVYEYPLRDGFFVEHTYYNKRWWIGRKLNLWGKVQMVSKAGWVIKYRFSG